MKRCGKCRTVKPISSFSKNKSRKSGIHNECKDCQVEYNRTYLLQRNYKITKEEAQFYLNKLERGCEICGKELKLERGNYAVDHCHKTMKVRGMLCRGCNQGLGHFEDDTNRMLKAIDYLRKRYA